MLSSVCLKAEGLARRGHPNPRKKRSENDGANENLSCGFPSTLGIAPEVAPRIAVFVLLTLQR